MRKEPPAPLYGAGGSFYFLMGLNSNILIGSSAVVAFIVILMALAGAIRGVPASDDKYELMRLMLGLAAVFMFFGLIVKAT